MKTITKLVRFVCALVAFTVTLVILDLPLKILSSAVILIVGIIGSIFYPVVKNWHCPKFLVGIYSYVTVGTNWFASKLWNLWMKD
jgi:hypothetical protein